MTEATEEATVTVRRSERRSSVIQQPTETCACFNFSDRTKAIKNLTGACVSFICCFGAFIGQLFLQSTINTNAGLGLISSSLIYGVEVVFLFFCPAVNCLLGSKYSIISGFLLILPYTLANYYPESYTLYPVSVLAGIALALMFVNTQVHVAAIANKYASSLQEKSDDAIVLYLTVFGMAIKVGQALGSLISSVTLINLKNNDTVDEDMSNETCNAEALFIEQDSLYYILVSIYLILGLVGLIISITTVDHLGTEATYLSASTIAKKYLITSSLKVLKLIFHWKMFLLLPLLLLNGISLGFAIGTFSKVRICMHEYLKDVYR